jgi:hypothetical protein
VAFEALEPSSGEKAFEIDADLVRDIFRDFEFDFGVSGIYLDNPGQRLRRSGEDGDLCRFLRVSHG